MTIKLKLWISKEIGFKFMQEEVATNPKRLNSLIYFPSKGIRIKGKSTISCPYGILVVPMMILA